MNQLDQHPTVLRHRDKAPSSAPAPLDTAWLKELARSAGADDVGFVSLDRPEVADQREDILRAFPGARSLMALVVRMNREPIRTPARSIANLEFHHTGDEVDDISRHIVSALEQRGVPALNPSMGFPLEMDRFPGKIWVVSHKPVAAAAGLGRIGIHRNLIHPRFGNFVLLGTVILGAEVDREDHPVDFNPCLECKLCVAACPVGAIGSDGSFAFSACYTHNYREFMGGFTDWVEEVADSKDARDYRSRVTDQESASMWQSLSFGANYKAAYCLAVCPAGEDVIAPFLEDRKGFLEDVVRPLQEATENVYVTPGTDAEDHVRRRFPHKPIRHVSGALRPVDIAGFLRSLPLVFQRGQAKDLQAIYHFTFTGAENLRATVRIDHGTLAVEDDHQGRPDLRITTDSRAWLAFLRKDRGLLRLLLTRKLRLRGPARLLVAFGKCFRS